MREWWESQSDDVLGKDVALEALRLRPEWFDELEGIEDHWDGIIKENRLYMTFEREWLGKEVDCKLTDCDRELWDTSEEYRKFRRELLKASWNKSERATFNRLVERLDKDFVSGLKNRMFSCAFVEVCHGEVFGDFGHVRRYQDDTVGHFQGTGG
jgi:hypothetical protein